MGILEKRASEAGTHSLHRIEQQYLDLSIISLLLIRGTPLYLSFPRKAPNIPESFRRSKSLDGRGYLPHNQISIPSNQAPIVLLQPKPLWRHFVAFSKRLHEDLLARARTIPKRNE